MPYNCEIKEQAAQPTLSIRTHTSVQALPQVIGQVYGEIGQYLGRLGEQPAGMPYAAYFNQDMQDLDVEIGFPVTRPLPAHGRIQPGEIPGVMSPPVSTLGRTINAVPHTKHWDNTPKATASRRQAPRMNSI